MPTAVTIPRTVDAATWVAAKSPALIAVAHGSRDPRSAATMSAVVARIAAARPDLTVRLAFLDLNTPSVEQVVDVVAAQGHTHAIVVPLLLGSAFHARVDLPGILAAAATRQPRLRLTQADVLGTDARLIAAVRDAVSAEGADPADERIGIAVAAVGSSVRDANVRTTTVARKLGTDTAWQTTTCFATTEPSLTQAVSRLRANGATRILVAPWFLAPGMLTDRLAATDPNLMHAKTIGDHPHLTDVVLDRYATAHLTAIGLSA
ncbi:sirohydrochlorin chelatase [Nocardia australiensis]|uniref:sirohydrochlorin chelatase n=1 Tax=Nocardia australiensis TaxID=2887191 RepID=UPI001D145AD7|nr:sirohydrochlorin chelatase [Nocardia australiensis]